MKSLRRQFFLFLYFFTVVSAKDVKLSPGFRLIHKEKTIYEGSTVLMYTTRMPEFDNFLSNYTCKFDEISCEIFNHVHKLAEHTIELLNHSLPHLSDLEDKRLRPRKSIEWFSTPLRYCCGVAQVTQIEELAMNHDSLEQLTDHLQSQLKEEHAAAVRNGQSLKNYSEEMKKVIGTQVRKNELALEALASDATELKQEASIFTDAVSILSKLIYRTAVNINFLKLIHQCRSNLIPTVILETGALKHDLKQIEIDLLKHNLQLAISINDIHKYLLVETSTCYFSEHSVVIRVNVPYITKGTHYKLYSVEYQPFLYKDRICTVNIDDDAIVEKNGKEIITLTKSMTHTCLSSPLCYVPKYPVQISHNQLCLETSLISRTTIPEIRKACPHKCSTHNLSKPIILRIDQKTFGIIYPNASLTLICEGKENQKIYTNNQVGILNIKIGCACKLLVKDIFVQAEHPCVRDDDSTSDVTMTHEISASWAFAADSLYINKHTTFHNVTKVINDNWLDHVPVYDPYIVEEKPFKPTFHQKNSHFFSYSTLFIVMILIVVVGVAIWKGKSIINGIKTMIDPFSLAQKVIGLLLSRPAVAEAKRENLHNESEDVLFLTFEITKIMLIMGILIVLCVLLYKLCKSKVLTLFTEAFGDEYDYGKIKISMISTENLSLPVRSIQQKFRMQPLCPTQANSNEMPLTNDEMITRLRERFQ